jgi:hypothetical protein
MRRVSLLTSNTADSNDDTASAAVVDNNSNHHPNAETMTLSAILALAGVTTQQLGSGEDNNSINGYYVPHSSRFICISCNESMRVTTT